MGKLILTVAQQWTIINGMYTAREEYLKLARECEKHVPALMEQFKRQAEDAKDIIIQLENMEDNDE